MRQERRLSVSEDRVLRRMNIVRGTRIPGSGENYIMRSSMICTPLQILFR